MNYRDRCFAHYPRECWVCGSSDRIEVHHIRGRLAGDDLSNLVPLCVPCHKSVHADEAQTGDLGKLQSVLWEHRALYPDVSAPGTLEFEDGELKWRAHRTESHP